MIFDSGDCRDNEFTCGNGQCIPGDQICDGRPDCRNQFDEDNCKHRTKIMDVISIVCAYIFFCTNTFIYKQFHYNDIRYNIQ